MGGEFENDEQMQNKILDTIEHQYRPKSFTSDIEVEGPSVAGASRIA